MGYETTELWQAMKAAKYRNTLDELAEQAKSIDNLNDALSKMLDTIVKAVHAETGSLWYYDHFGSGRIHAKAEYGGTHNLDGVSLAPGEGVAGNVIKSGKPEIVYDCQKDPRWAGKVDRNTGFQTKSMICVPLGSEGIFGCIQIINKVDGSLFDDKDFDFAMTLAKQVSVLFIERAGEAVVGLSAKEKIAQIGFDKAFLCDSENEALLKISNGIAGYGLSKRDNRNVVKMAMKIYAILHNYEI